MSNKSEATWHPNTAPELPHGDLITRRKIEKLYDAHNRPTDDFMDALMAALGDTVPASTLGKVVTSYEEALREVWAERDEARAERDALSAQLAEVDAAVGDPEHPRFSQPEVRARMHAIVKAATANEGERDRILALHDAEVKAQVWDEAVASAHLDETSNHLSIKHGGNPYRAEAK